MYYAPCADCERGGRALFDRKEVGEDASSTHIRLLDEAQRVEELSRILGGLTVTETTRSHARELLAEAEEMKKRDGIRKGTEMKQVGVVTEIRDGYAAVLVAKTSMCGENCGACKGGCKPGTQKGVGENRLRAGGPCRRPGVAGIRQQKGACYGGRFVCIACACAVCGVFYRGALFSIVNRFA